MKKWLLLLLLVLLVRPSLATDFFVSTTGKDSSNCAESTPCKTVTRANALVKPGDSVVLRLGSYSEIIGGWKSGAQGNPITYRSFAGETASFTSAQMIVMKSWIRLQRLNFMGIKGVRGLRFLGVVDMTGDQRNIKNDPTTKTFMVGIEILDCQFSDGTIAGTTDLRHVPIYFQGLGYNDTYKGPPINIIKGNLLRNFPGSGILISNYTTDTLIEGNTLENVSQGGTGPENGGSPTAEGVKMGGNSYRNVIRSNVCRNFIASKKAGSVSAYRLDVNSDNNLFENNQAWDINWPKLGSARGFGLYPESRCDRNRFLHNLLVRIGGSAINVGSDGTTKAVGNVFEGNTVDQAEYCFATANAEALQVTKNLCSNITRGFVNLQGQSITWDKHVWAQNNYWLGPAPPLQFYYGARRYLPPPNFSFSQWVAKVKEVGATQMDPHFVDPAHGDYHLKAVANPVAGKGAYP